MFAVVGSGGGAAGAFAAMLGHRRAAAAIDAHLAAGRAAPWQVPVYERARERHWDAALGLFCGLLDAAVPSELERALREAVGWLL